jgi:hypothetical protein
MLRHGDRVCYQGWDDGPLKADRDDTGTIEASLTRSGAPVLAVVWDTGEADQLTPSGWNRDHGFRVVPLGR